MLEIYLLSFIILMNALIFFLVGIFYFIKSAIFLDYLRIKKPKIYYDILGYGSGLFGLPMYNSMAFIKFTFDKNNYQDLTIKRYTNLFRKLAIIMLLTLTVITILGAYLFIKFKFIS